MLGATQSVGTALSIQKIGRKPSVLWWHVRNWLTYHWREIQLTLFVLALPVLRHLIPGLHVVHTTLTAKILHGDGTITDFGIIGRHLITTAGKNYLAGCMNNTNEPEILKYHGFGTGTTAAAVGDTTLQTELTTQYAADNTRPTATQSVSTNVYTTVGLLSPDTGGTIAVTEFGLFSASSSGTLYDRQTFSAYNLVAGSDSLQTTHTLTFS